MKALVLLNHLSMSPPIAELHAGVANELSDEGHDVTLAACDGSFLPCDHNPLSSNMICLSCKKTANNLSKELNIPILWLTKSDFGVDTDELNKNLEIGVNSTIASITRSPDEKYLSDFWRKYKINLMNSSIEIYHSLLRVLNIEAFDEIYLFNGRFAFSAAALLAAKKSGIDYSVYDQEKNSSFRIFHNTLLHDMEANCKRAENYYNENPILANEIALEFIKKKRCGEETYEKSFTSSQKSGDLDVYMQNNNIKEFVSIFPSSDDEYKYLAGAWKMKIVDQLESISTIAKNNPLNTFLVRMHPNMSGMPDKAKDDYYALERYGNIFVIPPASKISSYEVLDRSDVVIVFCSTIGVGASFVGKKTLGIGPNPYLSLDIFPVYSDPKKMQLNNVVKYYTNKVSAITWIYYLYTYSNENKYLSWRDGEILYKGRNFKKGIFLYVLILPSRIYVEILKGGLLKVLYGKLASFFNLK